MQNLRYVDEYKISEIFLFCNMGLIGWLQINRAELSKVFGELFFAIEPSYRGKSGKVQLQYSNFYKKSEKNEEYPPFYDGFYVPENVYIIATMNDIDRSIEPFDFAMKRRFTWYEILPNDTNKIIWKNFIWKDEAEQRMIKLNQMITNKFSSAYQIGGAYLLKLNQLDNSFDDLWKFHLEPVIKDYLKGYPNEQELLAEFKNAYNGKISLIDEVNNDDNS